MRNTARITTVFASLSVVAALAGTPASWAADAPKGDPIPEGATTVEKGKIVAFDRVKGNCLSCHEIAGGSLPGNIGPALVGVQARFPDKAKLRAQIYDSTVTNPNSIMPPFGRHGILSDEEIDWITEYVHTL